MPRPRLSAVHRHRRPTALTAAPRAVGALALAAVAGARDRFRRMEDRARAQRTDGGYSTETVLVIALLVALAIAVLGIIANLVIDKANSIEL